MTLRYLLDTDICIYIVKHKPGSVLRKFEKLAVGTVGMSTITYGEMQYGAQKSHHPQKALMIINELVSLIPPLPLSSHTGTYYGEIRSKLEKQGKPIGNNDLWIAAHALSLHVTLVTHNTKEFSRVPHLKIEDWT